MSTNNKDWTGNGNSIWKTLGASNHTDKERGDHDFYATSPDALELFAPHYPIHHKVWECACVDEETEILTNDGWLKIRDYNGQNILVSDLNGNTKFEKPLSYISTFTNKFYTISDVHLNMKLSSGHRMLYINNHGIRKVRYIDDIVERFKKAKYGFKGAIPVSFNHIGQLRLDEWKLRLAVACQADGKQCSKNSYLIRVKKERKKSRLIYLLNKCGIRYTFSYKKDGYYHFRFISEYGCKIFPKEWYDLCHENLRQIVDEVFYWDGTHYRGTYTDKLSKCYYTCIKENADFIQFAISACGHQSIISKDIRKERKTCYRVSYIERGHSWLWAKEPNKLKLTENSIQERCYCFKTSTGFFVARRNDKIFITGNCGNGSLSKWLVEHGHDVLSSDAVDRGYGITGIDFLKVGTTDLFDKDYFMDTLGEWLAKDNPNLQEPFDILTNPPFIHAEDFILHALDLIPENGRVIMFVKTIFLEGIERKKLIYDVNPPRWVYQFSGRILCAKNGDFKKMQDAGGSAVSYCWQIYNKHNDEHITEIKWI